MAIYHGTGYFIDYDDLSQLKISEVLLSFPAIDTLLIKPLSPTLASTLLENDTLLALLAAHSLAADEPLYQYGSRVCFIGHFEKHFDESTLDPDSGDYEMVCQLSSSEGFEYSVSNISETDHILEMLTAILKKFGLITSFDVLESYWFMMPYPNEAQ